LSYCDCLYKLYQRNHKNPTNFGFFNDSIMKACKKRFFDYYCYSIRVVTRNHC